MHHYRLNGAAFITTVPPSQRSMGNARGPTRQDQASRSTDPMPGERAKPLGMVVGAAADLPLCTSMGNRADRRGCKRGVVWPGLSQEDHLRQAQRSDGPQGRG